MSDVKIQSTPTPEAGAQTPLAVESKKSTHGFDSANQNSLSFCRGVEVGASSQPTERRFSQNRVNGVGEVAESVTSRGFAVAGREAENAKHVDQRCIEGSYPGDTRQRGADAKLLDNPAVRQSMGQAKLNSKLDSNKPLVSFPDAHGA